MDGSRLATSAVADRKVWTVRDELVPLDCERALDEVRLQLPIDVDDLLRDGGVLGRRERHAHGPAGTLLSFRVLAQLGRGPYTVCHVLSSLVVIVVAVQGSSSVARRRWARLCSPQTLAGVCALILQLLQLIL